MEHENSIGESDEWYTPKWIFDAFGCEFDLDPCSPGKGHWVPARKVLTKADDGLTTPWDGFVYMNPPFGGRNGHVPWLKRFLKHNNGIACFRAYTSSKWFHDYAIQADCLLFPRGKTKFIRPNGEVGRAPGSGVVFLGMGLFARQVLNQCDIGWVVNQWERNNEPCGNLASTGLRTTAT